MKKHLIFPKNSKNIPYITTDQMIEVDRLMIEEYGINLFQMMENAGRCLAIVSRELIEQNREKNILIIAGSGGNGGGGMTAARRLINWGYNVDILLTSDQARIKGTINNQLQILKNIQANIYNQGSFDYNNKYDIILDAMIGYSLRGPLRQNIIELINWVNIQNGTTISLDVPSGIDSTTGNVLSTCIKADYTMTLALPKTGFNNPDLKQFIGNLLLADISVPSILYNKAFDIDASDIFSKSDIVAIS